MPHIDRLGAIRRGKETLDGSMKEQVEGVLVLLERFFAGWLDTAAWPEFQFRTTDDGSVAIEWWFPNCRFAITLEHDPAESGWHFVTSCASGGPLQYGTLNDKDVQQALADVSLFHAAHPDRLG